MTVTKGKKIYSFPNTNTSNNNSDVETFLESASASDAESSFEERTPTRNAQRFPASVIREELLTLRKCCGKKKKRRYENRSVLQTLAEQDEDESPIVMLVDPYKGPFAKLLEDEDALEFWNVFVDKSEEEQAKFIEAFNRNPKSRDEAPSKQNPLSRISSKIKRTIKVRKNLSLEQVKTSEDDLIAFFTTTPRQIYVQHPPTYFERLLLHAIAQYHGLHSLGMVENGNKKVEIFNSSDTWIPAECFLSDFVAQLRK